MIDAIMCNYNLNFPGEVSLISVFLSVWCCREARVRGIYQAIGGTCDLHVMTLDFVLHGFCQLFVCKAVRDFANSC